MKLLEFADRVSYALLVVFIGLSLVVSLADRDLSELSSESIAPDNLRSAPERFRLKLLVEQNSETREELSGADSGQVLQAIEGNSASIDRISKSESWSSLEAELNHYADRLELLTEQRQSTSMILLYATAAVALASLILTIARTRTRNRLAQQGGTDQTAG
jgi:hypothetical protein